MCASTRRRGRTRPLGSSRETVTSTRLPPVSLGGSPLSIASERRRISISRRRARYATRCARTAESTARRGLSGFWCWQTLECALGMLWVSTKANPADDPSRFVPLRAVGLRSSGCAGVRSGAGSGAGSKSDPSWKGSGSRILISSEIFSARTTHAGSPLHDSHNGPASGPTAWDQNSAPAWQGRLARVLGCV